MYKLTNSLIRVVFSLLLVGTSGVGARAQSEFKSQAKEVTIQRLLPVDALDQAQKADKLILVTLSASGCEQCEALEERVFKNKLLGAYLKNKYVTVQQNVSDNQQAAELARLNRVVSYPSSLLFTSNGKLLGRLDSFNGPWDYITAVDEIRAASRL